MALRNAIVIVGGNGFVGTAVAKKAVQAGKQVFSISRSGRPQWNDVWMEKVQWLKGDILKPPTSEIKEALSQAAGVISVVGGFGSNEAMERMCGACNIAAIQQAKEAGVPRFVFVSDHDFKHLPDSVLRGYFKGKRSAEAELKLAYKNQGTILRPGMITGNRHVGKSVVLPLWVVGTPWGFLTDNALARAVGNIPLLGAVLEAPLVPPVSVESLASAAVDAVLRGDSELGPDTRILDVATLRTFH